MKSKIINGIFITFGIAAFALFIHSCKKTDSNVNIDSQEKIAMQRALQNAALQGQVTTFPVNAKAKMFFSDENGNQKTRVRNQKDLANGTSCADYDPLANDPATLVSVTRSFLCNSGYKYSVVWEVIVPNFNNLLPANPGNAAQKSIGRIRLKGPSNIVVDQDAAMSNLVITNAGVYSGDPTYNVWRFSFDSKIFSVTNVGNSITAEFSYSMYHTCFPSSGFLISVGYTPVNSISISGSNTNPCTRIDKIFINPPTGSGCTQPGISGSPSITGCNAVGQCTISGYTLPTTQYVRWRGVNASNVALSGAAGAWHYKRMQPQGGPTPYPSIYTFSATAGTDYTRCVKYEFQYVNEYTGCGQYVAGTYPGLATGLVGQEFWQF